MLGITGHQVEGPSVCERPAGLPNDTDDAIVVFQAVLLMPGGIGAAAWSGDGFNKYHTARTASRPISVTSSCHMPSCRRSFERRSLSMRAKWLATCCATHGLQHRPPARDGP
jgi:hypothetical protein